MLPFFIRKIDGVLFISFLRQKNQSLHLSSIVCTTCTHGRPISARVSVQVPKESRKQNKCQQPTIHRVWLQASVNLMIHEKATQLDTGQTSPKMFLNILKKSIPGCASWIFKIFSEFWNFYIWNFPDPPAWVLSLLAHIVFKTDIYRKTKTQIGPE